LPRELKKASLKDMSRQTIQLLEAFEGLPEEEKRIFTENSCAGLFLSIRAH
jgi:hypothetical protein